MHLFLFFKSKIYWFSNLVTYNIFHQIMSLKIKINFFFIENKVHVHSCNPFMNRYTSLNVATPLWPSVGVKPNTWKSWELESFETPECLELDSKGQNTSHWGVLGVIEKVLKRRYRKCPRIGNSDMCSPSYGQKKVRESNWQFDSRPLKVGNRCLLDIRFERATWR
jgi:hypothetical protein